MEVTNSTGLDTDYKVTSGGGTRDEGGWKPLPRRSKVEHAVENDEGPWKIEFRIPDRGEVLTGRFNDPQVHVALSERSGDILVSMHSYPRNARLRAAIEADPTLGAEISNLELLDDAALRNAAQTELPQPDSERMEELHRKQRLTGLSRDEAQELTRLEQQYERVLLVRSHSTALLQQRSQKVRVITLDPGQNPVKSSVA